MKRVAPPSWMEYALLLLLPRRDREVVSGDLHEEFCEQKLPRLGHFRASLWYLREVISFAPRRLWTLSAQPAALTLLCLFTAMSGSWLGVMDLRLRRPGYGGREWIAATIVAEALLTLAALHERRDSLRAFLRLAAMVGTSTILFLAATALMAMLRGGHPEGYVLLIALGLIVQALLTLFTLPQAQAPPRQSA